MGVLVDEVEVSINPANLKHYELLGYVVPKYKDNSYRLRVKTGTKILVKFIHIPKTSRVEIKVQCEKCKKIRLCKYIDLVHKNSGFTLDGSTLCQPCAIRGIAYSQKGTTRESGPGFGNFKHGSKGFSHYRAGALKRDLSFELSISQYKEITKLPCDYCGGFSPSLKKYEPNGIDRIDPKIGYVVNNCVPCCSTCNISKMAATYEEYIAHNKRRFLHQASKELDPEVYKQLLDLISTAPALYKKCSEEAYGKA